LHQIDQSSSSRDGICRPCSLLLALLLSAVLSPALRADWHIRKVAQLDQGMGGTFGWILGYRSSADSQPLLIFNGNRTGTHVWGNFFYRYSAPNRYQFVRFDTCWSDTLAPGNAYPWVVSDMNRDSVPELIGTSTKNGYPGYIVMYDPAVSGGCPDSLVVAYKYADEIADCPPCYIADLDHDGSEEILFVNAGWEGQIYILGTENDSLRLDTLIRPQPRRGGEWSLAAGDFDQDGRTEFATASGSTNNCVVVYKCTGVDQYALWDSCPIQLPNSSDVFSSDNIEGTHHSSLFVSFWVTSGKLWLYEFAPTQGTHVYQAFLVDSANMPAETGPQARSFCGDIDGDGIDELIWSCGVRLIAYKCTGPHQYQKIWTLPLPQNDAANVNMYDFNGNGYNEILESGCGVTRIFEIEAVKATRPQPGEVVSSGAYTVRWQKYDPPRCDSFSLFYTTDNSGTYLPIAHGLSPDDTSYVWNVPDLTSDSCKVKVVAFGPGTQFDETDGCFSIHSSNVVEWDKQPIHETKLVGPFPSLVTGPVQVRFQLREPEKVSLLVRDVTGRVTSMLLQGRMEPGFYSRPWDARKVSAGVYFLQFNAGSHRETRKLVLSR
jgi:hypothetical protein